MTCTLTFGVDLPDDWHSMEAVPLARHIWAGILPALGVNARVHLAPEVTTANVRTLDLGERPLAVASEELGDLLAGALALLGPSAGLSVQGVVDAMHDAFRSPSQPDPQPAPR